MIEAEAAIGRVENRRPVRPAVGLDALAVEHDVVIGRRRPDSTRPPATRSRAAGSNSISHPPIDGLLRRQEDRSLGRERRLVGGRQIDPDRDGPVGRRLRETGDRHAVARLQAQAAAKATRHPGATGELSVVAVAAAIRDGGAALVVERPVRDQASRAGCPAEIATSVDGRRAATRETDEQQRRARSKEPTGSASERTRRRHSGITSVTDEKRAGRAIRATSSPENRSVG